MNWKRLRRTAFVACASRHTSNPDSDYVIRFPMSSKRPRSSSPSSSHSSTSSPPSSSSKLLKVIPDVLYVSRTCTLPPTCSYPHKPTLLSSAHEVEDHYTKFHTHVCEHERCMSVFPDARFLELVSPLRTRPIPALPLSTLLFFPFYFPVVLHSTSLSVMTQLQL